MGYIMGSKMSEVVYSTAEISRKLDLPLATLRLWIAKGLVPEAALRGSGASLFTSEQVATIRKTAKRLRATERRGRPALERKLDSSQAG